MKCQNVRFSTIRNRSTAWWYTAALVVGAAVLAAGSPARADNLDTALAKHAPDVIRYLQEHHSHNVGILKFRVKKGNQPISFKVGLINDNMVERLEIALVHADPVGPGTIGIIHGANAVAMAKHLPRYDNVAGQRALFEQKYPLYWGNKLVTPDHFLTGLITVRPDMKSATVLIEAFGPTSPQQDKVVTFHVDTDRSLLADLSESFHVKTRGLHRRTRNISLEDEAVSSAADNDGTGSAGKSDSNTNTNASTADSGSTGTTSANGSDKLLDFQVYYDGVAQPVTADSSNPGELQVQEPNPNQVVTIGVKSNSQDKLGLVLMVNGVSTLYEEPLQSDVTKNLAWVLEPGQQYSIQGFQQDNNTRKPFRVLTDSETAAATYSPNLGLIQFFLVRSGDAPDLKNITSNDNNGGSGDQSGQSMNISLRGLTHQSLARGGHTRSLADLKKEVRSKMGRTYKTRNPIGADPNVVDGAIRNDQIQNPVLLQSIVVRYYKPKSA